MGPAGTKAVGDLIGNIQIDTLICPRYPIGGTLKFENETGVLTIDLSRICQPDYERTIEPHPGGGGGGGGGEGDLMAVEWSFGSDTSPVGTIASTTGEWQAIGSSGFPRLNSLARSPAGVYYSVTEYDTGSEKRLITIDPGTGAGSVVGTITGIPNTDYISGLAFSPAGTLFAVVAQNIHNTLPSSELYTLNPGSGAATRIGAIVGFLSVNTIEFDDAAGTLYGWDAQAGLITVNPASGAGTDVNPAVVGPHLLALAVLPDGTMVGGWHDFYRIDPGTGEATLIGEGTLSNVRGI